MDRRTLLGTVGSTGIVALTGCLSDSGGGDGNRTPAGTETETGTDTPAPTPAPSVDAYSLTVEQIQSGTTADEATVSVTGSTVTVEGTIWGQDSCQTAELPNVSYDSSADELTVPVRTTRREDAGDVCTQAVQEIEYTATITFVDGAPGSVVVTHDRGDGPEPVPTESP